MVREWECLVYSCIMIARRLIGWQGLLIVSSHCNRPHLLSYDDVKSHDITMSLFNIPECVVQCILFANNCQRLPTSSLCTWCAIWNRRANRWYESKFNGRHVFWKGNSVTRFSSVLSLYLNKSIVMYLIRLIHSGMI